MVKLLTLTSRSYLVIFLALTLFFFGIFYFIIQNEVFKSTDEILYNRKMHIIEYFNKNGNIPVEAIGYNDIVITPLNSRPFLTDHYSDTVIYESVDKEWDEFRKLTSSAIIGSKSYKITLVTPRFETHEIVESIIQSLFLVFIVMVAVFFVSTRYLSRRVWQPFYDTLQRLNNFEVEQSRELELTTTNIAEFAALNRSIQDLTARAQSTFHDQKQFIENASHELQTPLAITQSKLELLVEDPHLTEKQSEIIQTLIHSTQRLTRLNKTLLLLSKIENQQFLEKEETDINSLLNEILPNFEEQLESLNITLQVNIKRDADVHVNKVLMDLMITNLVKNAFFHNIKDGVICIDADAKHFSISNSSSGAAIPQEKLFLRFYKQSPSKDSWGLGLAMVKKICDINLWSIAYSFDHGQHTFIVTF